MRSGLGGASSESRSGRTEEADDLDPELMLDDGAECVGPDLLQRCVVINSELTSSDPPAQQYHMLLIPDIRYALTALLFLKTPPFEMIWSVCIQMQGRKKAQGVPKDHTHNPIPNSGEVSCLESCLDN